MSGIEMPSITMSGLRTSLRSDLEKLSGRVRLLVVGCDNAVSVLQLQSASVAAISLPCIAMLPPSFIEFALHEHHVEGVMISGCRASDCYHRLGFPWTEQRLAGKREPRLRSRAERKRIKLFWAVSSDIKELESELESFRASLASNQTITKVREKQ